MCGEETMVLNRVRSVIVQICVFGVGSVSCVQVGMGVG